MNRDQFSYYISFFHDGSLDSYTFDKHTVEFKLSSACLEAEENKYNIRLDDINCLVGRLILNGCHTIRVNRSLMKSPIYFYRNEGEILDFDIKDNKIELGISWEFGEYTMIEIEADQILWEDALNDITVNLTGLWTGSPRPPGED